jgi:hypothetical protein
LALILGALLWTLEILRQWHSNNDDGPPLGALRMAIPAVILIIAAGAIFSLGRKSAKPLLSEKKFARVP